jgi:hypothetical protein
MTTINGGFSHCTSLTSVIIPNSITSINGGFAHCTSLTSITIPGSVTYIGPSTFAYCTSLASITIPGSVSTIGDSAFSHCTGLTGVTFESGWSITIGDSAFESCTSLISFTLPDSATSIGDYAFENCTGLTSISIPDSVTYIGGSAFSHCTSLTSVTIPDSITTLRSFLFYYCTSLASVTIPDSVTSIWNSAFSHCTSLTDVTIPDSITTLSSYVFYYCTSLTSITIPGSVTAIEDYAFYGCSSLSFASFLGNAPSRGRSMFENCSPDFTVCFTSGATGFTTPMWPPWQGYPATDCACSFDSDCDDGSFCNGEEYCLDDVCFAGPEPCEQACDEEGDQCVECVVDDDCEYLEGCDDFACVPYPNTSTLVTISLKGPGVADVYYKLNEHDIAFIELTGTTEDSSLSIQSNLKKTPVYLYDLNIDGAMKSIKGKDVVLRGPLAATDGIGKMQIAATEAGSSIEAAWLGSLSIAGDVAGDMLLTGIGSPPKDLTLGKASIKGSLDNAQLVVNGNAGSVKVGLWGKGSTLAVGIDAGDDGRFFTDDDVPTGGWLKKFKFKELETIYNDGEEFGIIVDEFYKLKPKDRAMLPFEAEDFYILEK